MNAIFKFIAGNSRVTPVGVILAAALAVLGHAESWIAFAYVGVLLLTLAASTFERV